MDNNESQTSDQALTHADLVPDLVAGLFKESCSFRLRPYTYKDEDDGEEAIVAIVSVAGDVQWAAFIALPASTAVKVAEKFAGFEIPFEDEDMGDALGELANIFTEKVKTALEGKSAKVELSQGKAFKVKKVLPLVQKARAWELKCFKSSQGLIWTGTISIP